MSRFAAFAVSVLALAGSIPGRGGNVAVADGAAAGHESFDGLHRKLFANTTTGVVTDIRVESGTQQIIAAGPDGSEAWTVAGRNLRQTALPPSGRLPALPRAHDLRILLVPLAGGAGYDYLFRGNWFRPTQLFDAKGKLLWSAPLGDGINDAAIGDFLGTGSTEIAVAYNGDGGASLFDLKGKLLWNQSDGDVWHIARLDVPGVTAPRIVHSDAGDMLTVLDGHGNILSNTELSINFDGLSVAHWPTPLSPERVLAPFEGGILVLDAAGKTLATLDSVESDALTAEFALPFRLNGQAGYCFAVLTSRPMPFGDTSSTLAIYNAKGAAIDSESFLEYCGALALLPGKAGQPDHLLVGGTGHIYEF